MHRMLASLIAFVMAISFVHADAAEKEKSPKVQIMITGRMLGFGPGAGFDGPWFALMHKETGFELVRTMVTLRRVPDHCAGTATMIEAEGVLKPVFLVRGLDSLRPGPVKTVFSGYQPIEPEEGLTLHFSPWRRYGVFARANIRKETRRTTFWDYKLIFSESGSARPNEPHKNRQQTIVRFPGVEKGDAPKILWAGDLDRDGVLDLYGDTKRGVGTNRTLFLSSLAKPTDILARVANFATPAC